MKEGRFFEDQDPILEPRTSRTQAEARTGVGHSFVGDVNDLPTVVGGGTIHWDAKVPRFWRQHFKPRSLHGPVHGADVVDWPLTYDELAPYYDEVEQRLGVQGDVHRMPASTLAPGAAPPPVRDGAEPADVRRLAARRGGGVARLPRLSVPDGGQLAVPPRPPARATRAASAPGFGCPINARGSAALSFLHDALLAGAELRTALLRPPRRRQPRRPPRPRRLLP